MEAAEEPDRRGPFPFSHAHAQSFALLPQPPPPPRPSAVPRTSPFPRPATFPGKSKALQLRMTPGCRPARYLPRLPALWTRLAREAALKTSKAAAGRANGSHFPIRAAPPGRLLLSVALRNAEGGSRASLSPGAGRGNICCFQHQQQQEEEQLRGCRFEQQKRLHFFSSDHTFFTGALISAMPPPPSTSRPLFIPANRTPALHKL